MEYEPQFCIRSPMCCSSTCITNDFAERSSEMRVNLSSHNDYQKSKNSHVMLPGDQEMIASTDDNSCILCINSSEPLCHVKLESVDKLKESTKQLLCLLEEIQSKTRGKNTISDDTPKFTNYIKTLPQDDVTNKENNIINIEALKNLEANAKKLDVIFIADDHDDCTVYRRLTRKCHCLNHPDYNDFVIHFNEDSKYTTSNLGEIIKNMRILKKFLYMGGNYTRNALMFLNEGMMESPHSERVEMSQACGNADICNLFEDQTFIVLISWPCKNKYFGDNITQALAAGFLYKLAQIEEGRRYLNYSSKIINDIKRVLRKKGTSIEIDTVESLNATLNLLKPVFAKNVPVIYFNKYEGIGKRIISDLVQQRKYMTFNEVLLHLEMLEAYSQYESGRSELTLHLSLILLIFKHLLMEYDNSEINMTVTSLLNTLISKNKKKDKEFENSNTITETATQVFTVMRSEECQIPPKKASSKKINKSKIGLGGAPNKFRQPSKRQVSEWESINVRSLNTSVRTINRSKKFRNERAKKSIIFVPLEK